MLPEAQIGRHFGPTGDGVAGDSKAPITWAIDQHVAWKTPMPGPGNGSPIVLNRQVIVTSAEDPQGKQRSLLSFDALTGEQQKQTVAVERHMPTHKTNPQWQYARFGWRWWWHGMRRAGCMPTPWRANRSGHRDLVPSSTFGATRRHRLFTMAK